MWLLIFHEQSFIIIIIFIRNNKYVLVKKYKDFSWKVQAFSSVPQCYGPPDHRQPVNVRKLCCISTYFFGTVFSLKGGTEDFFKYITELKIFRSIELWNQNWVLPLKNWSDPIMGSIIRPLVQTFLGHFFQNSIPNNFYVICAI